MTSSRSSPSRLTRISPDAACFDPGCTRCERLARFLADVRDEHSDYHAAPVPAFGASAPTLLIVGLAPGMHGANRTGRPFTGDHAGILLYQTLHAHGFASAPASSHVDDGLALLDCRITNAVKCLPPANKPLGSEIAACNDYLANELACLPRQAVVLALGSIAHQAVIRALGLRQKDYRFRHAGEHALPEDRRLVDCYHCSRYNTQTRRLTPSMFDAVFRRLRELVDGAQR
jgi:uracil-DNA glycosylase family 4